MPRKFYFTYPLAGVMGVGIMWLMRDSIGTSKPLWWLAVVGVAAFGVIGALSALRASVRVRPDRSSTTSAFASVGVGFGLVAVFIARYTVGTDVALWFCGLAMAFYPVAFYGFLLSHRTELAELRAQE